MHLNHAMANYQQHINYAPPGPGAVAAAQIATHGGLTPTTAAAVIQQQQSTTIAAGLQQSPFTLHQLTAVQAIQHPTHQAMLHPQHPLVHLLDISSTATNSSTTPHLHAISPPITTKVEIQSEEESNQVDDPRKKKQCHVCKNKFRQLTTLRNHMKIHTDER